MQESFVPSPNARPWREKCQTVRVRQVGELSERRIHDLCGHLYMRQRGMVFCQLSKHRLLHTSLGFLGSTEVLPGQMNLTPNKPQKVGIH